MERREERKRGERKKVTEAGRQRKSEFSKFVLSLYTRQEARSRA